MSAGTVQAPVMETYRNQRSHKINCAMCGRDGVMTPRDDPGHTICASCWNYAGEIENAHFDYCKDGVLDYGIAGTEPCRLCGGLTPAMYAAKKAPTGRTQSVSTVFKNGRHHCPGCDKDLNETKFPTRKGADGVYVRDPSKCRACKKVGR